MSSYYLCDTCAQPLKFSKKLRVMVCEAESTMYRKVISDNQTPQEVCKNWKPKEQS